MLCCPETDLKRMIPVLLFYLGGNSKRCWSENGESVEEAVKGLLKPAIPEGNPWGNLGGSVEHPQNYPNQEARS